MDRSTDADVDGEILRLLDRLSDREDVDTEKLGKLAVATTNPKLENAIRRYLQHQVAESLDYPFETVQPSGRIRLGTSFDGQPFLIDTDTLTKHLLTVGQSGSGKTTLFYTLFSQFQVPCWQFDLKQDYRHLLQYYDDLLVLPWWQLKFNPLRPPTDTPPRRWAQVFSEIFSHATSLLSGSKNYLLKQVIELYRHYNLFNTVSPPYPSLHEFKMLIDADKMNYTRKAANYRDTIQNRIETMTLTAGTVFDCSHGYEVENLLQQDVVFEFDGLSRDVQNFLVEILFAYTYEYRLAQSQRNEGLNHVFFIDEGKRVFSVYKERQDAAGIPKIDELTAKMREFGEGLIVADQEASKLTDSIKANTFTKILMPTGDQKQRHEMAEAMDLTPNQRRFARDLEVGTGIVQIGNDNPVPVDLDKYTLDKDISDEELQRKQAAKWNDLSHEPRDTTPSFEKAIGHGSDTEQRAIPEDPQPAISLSDDAVQLLEDVVENPFVPITERYDNFSSAYKGNKAKDELTEAGVLVERQVRHGQSQRKLLELTDQGRVYLQENHDIEVKRNGRGGIVHRYWQQQVKQAFETAGWSAEIEVFDTDVYVNMHEFELAIEIAMEDTKREVEHLKQRLDTDLAVVWVLCRNNSVRDGLQQRADECEVSSESVRFLSFREFSDIDIGSA